MFVLVWGSIHRSSCSSEINLHYLLINPLSLPHLPQSGFLVLAAVFMLNVQRKQSISQARGEEQVSISVLVALITPEKLCPSLLVSSSGFGFVAVEISQCCCKYPKIIMNNNDTSPYYTVNFKPFSSNERRTEG